MQPSSISNDDSKRLTEYGLSSRAIAMLTAIGKRYDNHPTTQQDVETELEKIGMPTSQPLVKFQEAFAGIQYSAPAFRESSYFEQTHDSNDPSNRVLGAYFGIVFAGKAPKIPEDEILIRCGGMWNDHDGLFISLDGGIHYPSDGPRVANSMVSMVRVSDSLIPFLEQEAFSFANCERLPFMYRYLFSASAAMKAVEAMRSDFSVWDDFEPGYSIATRDDGALLVSRNWGAPRDEWELAVYVPRHSDGHPLVDAIESFEFIGRVEGKYSVEAGWT
jgi:hypothetical protein